MRICMNSIYNLNITLGRNLSVLRLMVWSVEGEGFLEDAK